MGDPAFAGMTDFGIEDMFRRALRSRSEAEHMNPVLHQACVYRAAALERELAIRNAREQARLDAEAGSPQPSDVQVVELLDEVQRLRSERDANERVAAEIQLEVERMAKLLEHAEVASKPALDVEFLRRVTSYTKHGPYGAGGAGPCSPTCLKCEAERRLKEMTDG